MLDTGDDGIMGLKQLIVNFKTIVIIEGPWETIKAK